MTYEFSGSDEQSFNNASDPNRDILKSLTNFDPGLGGFDGMFEGSEMRMFCSNGGALSGVADKREDDTRVVLAASLNPGTRQSQAVGNELIKKSLVLGQLAAKRNTVVNLSRGEIQKLLTAIKIGDERVAALARRVSFPGGGLNPNADPRDLKALQDAYDHTKELGRRALRFGKVNALATTLRNNAMQQTQLLQQIAAAQSVGQPNIVAALSGAFNTLGRESDKIRTIRQAQLQNTPAGQDMLEGIAFGDLAWFGSKLFKSVKKAVNKVTDTVHSIPGIKQVSGLVHKGMATVRKAVGAVLNASCKLATSTVGKVATKAAGTIVGTVYGGPAGGAIGNVAGNHANDLNEKSCDAIKSLGLSKGKLDFGAFSKSVVTGAKAYAKKNLNPKNVLKEATSIGGAYMSGGGGNAALSNYGGQAISKLGLSGDAQQFLGRALKATQGKVTGSAGGQQLLQQFGGRVGGQLISKLQGNTLRNNAVAQAAGNALISGGPVRFRRSYRGFWGNGTA